MSNSSDNGGFSNFVASDALAIRPHCPPNPIGYHSRAARAAACAAGLDLPGLDALAR
jgi:hypothetical protein